MWVKLKFLIVTILKDWRSSKDTKKEIGENRGFEFGKGKVEIGINKILYIREFQRNKPPK